LIDLQAATPRPPCANDAPDDASAAPPTVVPLRLRRTARAADAA